MPSIDWAGVILALHLAIVVFNVGGLIVIPLGAWRRWRIVRVGWLRLLHLVSLAVVAGQALAGRACFLTLWQDDLTVAAGPPPLIARWMNALVYWNLPFWVFVVLYSAAFLYVLALSFFIPFGRRR